MYQKLARLYDEGYSLRELADKFGVSHMQVKRILLKAGHKLRDSSEAQSNFMKRNPDKHPTRGKKREEKTKLKISETYSKYLEDGERERRSKAAKTRWENLGEAEKEVIRKKTSSAFRATAKTGSSLEKFIMASLSNAGYVAEFHKELLIENNKMHIDIFLPSISVAIEIDGPSHYIPMFGQEILDKTIDSDTEKNGLLLSRGITIIRVKHLNSSLSKFKKHTFMEELKKTLEKKPVGELIRLEI